MQRSTSTYHVAEGGGFARRAMGLAAVASVAVPLAFIWAALAMWLGRAQQRIGASAGSTVAASSAYPRVLNR